VEWKASSWFRKTWWVAAFCGVALLAFGHAMKNRTAAIAELRFRLSEAEKISLLATQEKEELAQQIASQSDPAWIELVLLREVGVVPEGFLKVHFKK
jgi:hypothetical protein